MKQYKNAIRSKKLLKDALIDLISSGIKFQDITITMLINKADVNRGTFYNHYNNIMDIANELKDEIMNKLYNALEETTREKKSIENFFEGITNFLKENEETYKKLTPIAPKQVLDGMKNQSIKLIETALNCKTQEDFLKARFLANSISGSYFDYFEGRIDNTLDELKLFSIKVINMFLEME